MNVFLLLAVLTLPAHAEGSSFDCLQASARNGGLAACLNESAKDAPPAVAAGEAAPSTSLRAAPAPVDAKASARWVPTPTGFANAADGTLKAGFYKGLDSGFKTVFMGFVGLPVLGIEASGAPHASNAGTFGFTVLGVILAIPGSIVGALVGAPLGAVAGIIAEKVSPGSTRDWFTF